MRCPFCLSTETKVIETRSGKDGFSIKRRRECTKCGKRFTTFERIEESFPMVIKKDGRREPYNREKLFAGIKKAFEKRPISMEEQEHIVNEVERFLLALGEKEVSSKIIGERVIQLIKEIDEVAYVRFASVYKQFKDIEDFMEELKKLKGQNED